MRKLTDNWKDLIFVDTPKIKVDERARQQMMEPAYQMRYGGDARSAMGLIWIDEEFEEYRQRVLNTPLP